MQLTPRPGPTRWREVRHVDGSIPLDTKRLDVLARGVAAKLSRRSALAGGIGGVLAGLTLNETRTAAQALPGATPGAANSSGVPASVKVLTVTMYQDLDHLSAPNTGEAQPWITREHLDVQIPVPGSHSPVYCDAARAHCLVVTGMGMSNAAATMMAVGLSPALDLTKAYILISGIAGTPPGVATLGSAAWAEWVVNGAQANLIDPRELPSTWLYPYFHLGCTTPWCTTGYSTGTEVFHLNPALTEAAFQISKGVALADSADAQSYRANFPDTPAQAPPSVLRGDSFASDTLIGGRILSDYAQWWTHQWTTGKGTYVMSNNEDAGTLTALQRLANAGLVDWQRIMVLRAASDFDQPYPGQDALGSIEASTKGGIPVAYGPSIENAYRVGSAVTHQILSDWDHWKDRPPTG